MINSLPLEFRGSDHVSKLVFRLNRLLASILTCHTDAAYTDRNGNRSLGGQPRESVQRCAVTAPPSIDRG